MKKIFLFSILGLLIFSSCARKECPAYNGGKSTGTLGSKDKSKTLFSKSGTLRAHSIFYVIFHHKKKTTATPKK